MGVLDVFVAQELRVLENYYVRLGHSQQSQLQAGGQGERSG